MSIRPLYGQEIKVEQNGPRRIRFYFFYTYTGFNHSSHSRKTERTECAQLNPLSRIYEDIVIPHITIDNGLSSPTGWHEETRRL